MIYSTFLYSSNSILVESFKLVKRLAQINEVNLIQIKINILKKGIQNYNVPGVAS